MLDIVRRTLDNQIWSKDTHSRDTDTRLCGAVSGAEAGEDDSGCATHGTEEGLDNNMSVRCSRARYMRFDGRIGILASSFSHEPPSDRIDSTYRIDGAVDTHMLAVVIQDEQIKTQQLYNRGAALSRYITTTRPAPVTEAKHRGIRLCVPKISSHCVG